MSKLKLFRNRSYEKRICFLAFVVLPLGFINIQPQVLWEYKNNHEASEVPKQKSQGFQVDDKFTYVTPPMSLSVIRIKIKS